jgi:hypothetical protein
MESSRKKAILLGEETYFTGKPCIHGHIAPRKLNGYCVECRKIHELVYMRNYLKNYNSNYIRKDNRSGYFKEYDKNRDKIKVMARIELNNAIRHKIVEKQSCSVCGNSNSQAHHIDYTKPLDVIWLCPVHHSEIHRL